MDAEYRKNLHKMLKEKEEKYDLEQLFYMTFTATMGFRSKMCSADYVHSAASLMERLDPEEPPATGFLIASDALDLSKPDVLTRGIDFRKLQLRAIYQQVHAFLAMNQVICAGPFLYATVLQGTPDAKFFAAPHSLNLLATYTLRAHVTVSRSRKCHALPLILTSPDVRFPDRDYCLVCGIPPFSETSKRNLLGKAFEQAAEKTGARADLDFFDTNGERMLLCC